MPDPTDEIGVEETVEAHRIEMEEELGEDDLTMDEVQEEADRMRRLDEAEHDMTDVEADADTLRSAGMGTDEDYGFYGDY